MALYIRPKKGSKKKTTFLSRLKYYINLLIMTIYKTSKGIKYGHNH